MGGYLSSSNSSSVLPPPSAFSPSHTSPQAAKDKKASSLVLLGCILFGAAGGLIGLNYYHSTKCEKLSPDVMEDNINAMNHRLALAEAQMAHNTATMNKLIFALQERLTRLDTKEIEQLIKETQNEAVRVALLQSLFPAPPMPEFVLDSKYSETGWEGYKDDLFASAYGKKDDDLYKSSSYNYTRDGGNFDDKYGYDDKGEGGGFTDGKSAKDDDTKHETMTDAEALKACTEWKEKYSVAVGVSWGSLPFDLQQRWVHASCDYHLQQEPIT